MNLLNINISTILGLIDWRTFFDVPIIAAAIFFLYRTLRSSGAWRIVLGIFIALSVYTVAQAFNFMGINWLFSNLSNIALIALIIIFQPEIRKIFEKAASTLRIKEAEKEGDRLASMIAEAVSGLAQKKWGAIIVLPGKDSLRPKVSGGTSLNAAPSSALIMSIFDPHSPGHDGALVIEGGKITEFGIRLPLSSSEELGEEFGTRHHAALGLSEVTDSLVIVVSEERGSVCIFFDGKHFPLEDTKDLCSHIESFWQRISSYAPVKRSFRKRAVTLFEMAMSLMVAFLLWSSIMLSTTQIKEMGLTVPIEYMVSNSDMVLMGEKPTATRIRLSGTSTSLNLIKPQELKATVDLTRADPGKQLVTISRSLMQLPQGVNLADADPSVFEVTLQSLIEKEVLIKPQIVGALPRGLEISSIDINPQKIKILYSSDETGQKEIFLTTTPIYLQNITENTKLLCNLIAPPDIYPLDKQWPDVVVTISLRPSR